MAERSLIHYLEKHLLEDLVDTSILTGLEHGIRGSSFPNLLMEGNPLLPQAIVERSKTITEVNLERQRAGWFADNVIVSEVGGLACLKKYTALLRLPLLDPMTGELSELPSLYGVYDADRREIITDEATLSGLPICPQKVNAHIIRTHARLLGYSDEAAS